MAENQENQEMIEVQVCYARPGLEILRPVCLAAGSTVQQAIVQSDIVKDVPEIDLGTCKVGIFTKLKTMETVLRANDRVEIYRPLQADPKTARRQRVEQKRASKK